MIQSWFPCACAKMVVVTGLLTLCLITIGSALKCYQCGGLSGLPCAGFNTDKIQYQKVCNATVQSCITSYSNGEITLRDCWTNRAETTTCDGVDSLTLCMCANSDFCNCHSNPDLNGEKCPIPPSAATNIHWRLTNFVVLVMTTIITCTPFLV